MRQERGRPSGAVAAFYSDFGGVSSGFRVEGFRGSMVFFFQGLAPPWFGSPFGDFLRFWSSGPRVPWPLVPWSSGPVVPWSPGPLVPWCPGSLVLWSPGPLVPWSSGFWCFGPMVLVLWSSGPLVLWSLDPLVFSCGFWKDRNTANYSLWSF